MDRAVMSSPMRRKAPRGWDAISPQTLTSIPAALPTRATWWSCRTTAGWNGL